MNGKRQLSLVLLVVALTAAAPSAALAASTASGSATTASGSSTTYGSTATAGTVTSPTSLLGSSSFGLGSAGAGQTTTQTLLPSTGTTTTGSGGLSGVDAILIGAVTLLLLVGVAAFVMRDARSHTRGDKSLDDDPLGFKRKGSKAPPRSRKLKPAERKRRKRGRAPRRR